MAYDHNNPAEAQAPFEFTFVSWIARGGFGDVYRAVRKDTGGEIAVKVLREYGDPECVKRFEREIRTLMALNGKRGIVPILGYNLNAEPPFYAMPLMKGGTLAQHVGKLEHAVVRDLLRHFADVLQHVHERGGLHRDIKPANVLLDSKGVPAVGDFGLGNDPACTVMLTAHACGTPGYMAPELTQPFGTASTASDVYALGATAFELLTGIHPTQTESLDPWKYDKAVPKDLRTLVVRMVDPRPERRPTTADLIKWMGPGDGTPARVPLLPSLGKVLRWIGVGALAAGAALVAVVGIGALIGSDKD